MVELRLLVKNIQSYKPTYGVGNFNDPTYIRKKGKYLDRVYSDIRDGFSQGRGPDYWKFNNYEAYCKLKDF